MSDRTFERIEKLFDISLFKDVRALIAGCGSGGASVALQLAMSGIPNFALIDNDTLGSENVIRHVCGRRFVGAKKVDAVAEVLLDRNPAANIEKIEADILRFPGLPAEIKKADVVVLATDNEPTRYVINDLCVRSGVPFVVGRVFTRGIGGEVFAYRPPDGACLACIEEKLRRSQFREGIKEIDLVSEEEREKIYGMEDAEIKNFAGSRSGYLLHHVLPHAICPGCGRPPPERTPEIPSADRRKLSRVGQPAGSSVQQELPTAAHPIQPPGTVRGVRRKERRQCLGPASSP